MNTIEVDLGAYALRTAHLTPLEEGLYWRLLRAYYAKTAALPADLAWVQRIVGTKTLAEKTAVGAVLEEFFALDVDGWHPRSGAGVRVLHPKREMDVSEGEWLSLRARVFARDGHCCVYCGSTERLACDHIHPLSRGGASVLENLTTACTACNSAKGAKTLAEWRPELVWRAE